MDYRHFQELLAGKAAAQTSVLQELLHEYPYCQAGHLLLVKTLHEQQHIRYEPALRTAAAHQPDRRVLYRIVHEQPVAAPESVFREEAAVSPESPFLESASAEAPLLIGDQHAGAVSGPGIFSDHYRPEAPAAEPEPAPTQTQTPELSEANEALVNPHIQEEPVAMTTPTLPTDDPREVLRRRLAELLGTSPQPADVTPAIETPNETAAPATDDFLSTAPAGWPAETGSIETEEIIPTTPAAGPPAPDTPADAESIVEAETESLEDPVFREELSVALEETLLHELERLPEIPSAQETVSAPPAPEPVEASTAGGNFFSWLRSRQVEGFGQVEAVHAEVPKTDPEKTIELTAIAPLPPKAPDVKTALIDKFIAEEPRIVPSKTEFYNPVVQAKRSVEEHEDVVSETLAGIYAAQGNLLKARSAYQRLGLLHPEKSTYFAALVREIDEKLNSSSSEDL